MSPNFLEKKHRDLIKRVIKYPYNALSILSPSPYTDSSDHESLMRDGRSAWKMLSKVIPFVWKFRGCKYELPHHGPKALLIFLYAMPLQSERHLLEATQHYNHQSYLWALLLCFRRTFRLPKCSVAYLQWPRRLIVSFVPTDDLSSAISIFMQLKFAQSRTKKLIVAARWDAPEPSQIRANLKG